MKHLQPLLDRQPRRDNEHGLGEFLAGRVGQRVQDLPSDDHRHDRGLAGTGRHFVAQPLPLPAVAGYRYALLECRVSLHPPNQGFDGFQLAEVKRIFPCSPFVPVLEQAACHGGHAGIVRQAPFREPPADALREFQGYEAVGVVARVGDEIPRRTSFLDQFETFIRSLPPVTLRRVVRRIDDQPVDDAGPCGVIAHRTSYTITTAFSHADIGGFWRHWSGDKHREP